MPPSGPPTVKEIWKIALRTTDIIETNITKNVCLFGSAACSLWVNIGRIPGDVDIVVSERNWHPEAIKRVIARVDNRYILDPSKIPGKKHCKLYCLLPGWRTDDERYVKVDILVPPTLNLPKITESDAVRINDIPVMPIFDLLVMKTQGWWDHRTSDRRDWQDKESADVSDILALLWCAREEGVSYVYEAGEYRHSPEFMSHALALVNEFVSVYRTRKRWRALRFPV